MIIRKSAGFTLIELMIAASILAILSVLAAPSLHDFFERTQTRTVKNQLIRHLTFARINAIKSGYPVIICASADALNCSPSTNWSEKRLFVFKDLNHDNKYKPEQDEVLRITDALPQNSFLKLRAFQNKSYIKWLPQGTTSYQNGNLTYCPSSLDPKCAKHLIWNVVGRIYEGKDTNKNGIVENTRKKDVTCS